MVEERISYDEFDTLFYPAHIAFIGASESSKMGSMLYLKDFRESQWADNFYPVNPKHKEVLGWKCYSSVLDIPYPIDTAYVSVKREVVPLVVKECVDKQVKWVIIFSSGFSELGDKRGTEVEVELKRTIEDSNTRIIGPNCLGPYNGTTGMAFSFASSGKPGNVSFMSQSGGHLSKLLDIGEKRDIRFRYGVSFGNQIDLNCVDFISHYREDDKTKVIAAYLESFGSTTGHEFFIELQKTTKKKPVVLWKGGYTQEGARAAFSHTGAISSNYKLWMSLATQTGTSLVADNEEFWNAIKTFELWYPKYISKGRNIGIITPGGGSSVNITDIFASYNMNIPNLTSDSQQKISEILPRENVNISNPIDLGASGFVVAIYYKCIEIVANDPNIDIILIPFWPHHVYRYVFKEMVKILKKSKKPYAFCLPSLADSLELVKNFEKAKKILHSERSLYYFHLKDAARSIELYCDYIEYLNSKQTKEKY